MKSFVFLLLLSFSKYVLFTSFSNYSKMFPYYRNVVPASQLDAPVLVNGVLNELYDAFKVNETTAYLFEYTFARSQLGKY